MAKQDINYGTTAGDGTGESLFAAFKKAKENFTELYGAKTEFVANYAALPATGEALKIYVALDTGVMYRWSGSAYVQMTLGFTTDANGNTVLVGADGVPVYLPSKVFSALLNKTADQVLTKGSVLTKIDWAGQSSALGGIVVWDAANPSRLTIPTGFSAAKITGQVRLDDAFANQPYTNHIYKNGSLVYDGVGLLGDSVSVAGPLVLPVTSPWLPVAPGDYFELGVINTNATTDNWVLGTVRTWVSIELAK